MSLPSASSEITANDINSELGRLLFSFTANSTTVSTLGDRITVSNYQGPFLIFANNDAVLYTTNNTVIGGLSNNTTYYIRNANSTSIQLSTASGGSAVNLTSTGSGTHYLSRASTTINFDGERERRLADTTSGTISFDSFASKSRTKTYSSGNTFPSRTRNIGFTTNFVKYAGNTSYYVPENYYTDEFGNPGQYNCGALDIDCYDTTAYANAMLQSQNLTFTIRVSYDTRYVDTFSTNFGAIMGIKPAGYPSASFTDFSNQPPLIGLNNITNASTVSNIRTGDIVKTMNLTTGVTLGSDGGWSQPSFAQWNLSKIASTSHIATVSMNIVLTSGANSQPIQIHWVKINGTYDI